MSPSSTPFSDRRGIILQTALTKIQNKVWQLPGGKKSWHDITMYKTYAVQCVGSKPKPPAAATNTCMYNLYQTIVEIQPKLTVVFGATAFKSLALRGKKFSSVRGMFLDYKVPHSGEPHTHKVFVTYSLDAVVGKPGLFNDLLQDLSTAIAYVQGKQVTRLPVDELVKDYVLPKTVEEIEKVCSYIINYAKEGKDPSRHIIGCDTETSALEMHDPSAKMIASSFAWDAGKATAILVDHPDVQRTEEEAERVRAAVRSVWECSKPKVLHNEKFDRKVVEGRYGWDMRNVVWDTMCGEHLLEESKKNHYGLKGLTRTRLPAYAGYDDAVDAIKVEHGGLDRATEAKRMVKAKEKYSIDYRIYQVKYTTYEKEKVQYNVVLSAWNEKRLTEKEKAKKERRKMDRTKYGKKPTKPREPKKPVEPEPIPPFDYTLIPVDMLLKYAAIDADVCRQHLLHQNKRLNTEHKQDAYIYAKAGQEAPPPVKQLMSTHVIPTSKTLATMEFTGFPVDLEYLKELDTALKGEIAKYQQELYSLVGEEFKANDPRTVIQILFNQGFYEPSKNARVVVPITDDLQRTPTNQLKADKKALIYVHTQYGYRFPEVLLMYRKATKARNPFLVNVREHANLADGRMHATFHIHGTATGRLSSSNENMQNFPKKLGKHNIKNIFVPPGDNVLVNADAKAAEIRLFAAYSMDEKLISAIKDGLDTHSFFVSELWPDIKYDEVEDARRILDDKNIKLEKEFSKDAVARMHMVAGQRDTSKRAVFGTLYGATSYKIAETAGVTQDEAQRVIDLMFSKFPTIPAYIQGTHREVVIYGAVYTKTGRKRRFPLNRIRMFRNRSFRQAVNFKIQATSSDIVMWVLNQVAPIIIEDLRGELHTTVHDSIVFSVPPKYLSQVPDMMELYGTKKVAEHFKWLPVPFIWDVQAGLRYGDVSSIDSYLKGIREAEEKATPIIEGEEIREEINEELIDP